jgi:rhomboid protease GluP
MIDEPAETTIRVSARPEAVEEWAIVLTAVGIPHRVAPVDEGWALVVPDDEVPRARTTLAAYEEENRATDAARVPAPVPEGPGAAGVGLGVAACLVATFLATGPRAPGAGWVGRGVASSEHILAGEWWRTVTALTLHVDVAHVAGNAIAAALLLAVLGARLGAGLALAVMLGAGALGNGLAAVAHGAGHLSVGASTATFGAIGLLAALRVVGAAPAPRRRAWVIVVACLVLLGLLGTGPGVDVLAHVFGLVAGGAVGIVVGAAVPRPPVARVQWGLLAATAAVVVVAWARAA